MKLSKVMLKGFAMAGGNQCYGKTHRGPRKTPTSVCAVGAINLAVIGSAKINCAEADEAALFFLQNFGFDLCDVNDGNVFEQKGEPMSIPDIAGILAAEGY